MAKQVFRIFKKRIMLRMKDDFDFGPCKYRKLVLIYAFFFF